MVAIPAFQQYQLAFTAHIRNPSQNKKPDRVNAKRMRVYTEIVFNNLESSVAACFPVCKKVLGISAWTKLVRQFFTSHQSTTPIFREIPQQFLSYLATVSDVPVYLQDLAHYEWVELAIATMQAELTTHDYDAEGDLLDHALIFNPAMMLLAYDYPVQLISPKFKPKQALPEPVNLLVFRDADDEVKFMELNAVTASMLQSLAAGEQTARHWLQVYAELSGQDVEMLINFGLSILQDLRAQGVILGSV